MTGGGGGGGVNLHLGQNSGAGQASDGGHMGICQPSVLGPLITPWLKHALPIKILGWSGGAAFFENQKVS